MLVVEVFGADSGNCHCAQNENMVACHRNNVHIIWMRSKRAAPKRREVCQSCADWVVRENLADIASTTPRDEYKNVCHLILVAVLTFSDLTGSIVLLLRVGATASSLLSTSVWT